jgi:hypothetical protein
LLLCSQVNNAAVVAVLSPWRKGHNSSKIIVHIQWMLLKRIFVPGLVMAPQESFAFWAMVFGIWLFRNTEISFRPKCQRGANYTTSR